MVNAEAGPSRSGASEPAAPPSTAGHWPLGTKVKVLVDPHSKSSSQDKEPILRIFPAAHLTNDMGEATHILVDPAHALPAEAVFIYREMKKHLVTFKWAIKSFSRNESRPEHRYAVVGVEAGGAAARAGAAAVVEEAPREPTPVVTPVVEPAQPEEEEEEVEEEEDESEPVEEEMGDEEQVVVVKEEEEEMAIDDYPSSGKRTRSASVRQSGSRKRTAQGGFLTPRRPALVTDSDEDEDEEQEDDEWPDMDGDEDEMDELSPSQAAAEASPPPSTPSPSLAAALASAAVNGTPMFAGPRAALGVLFAREARGRPFGHTPKKVLSAARRRLWGGEDCHALAESLCIDEVDFDAPGCPSSTTDEPDPGCRGWSKREIRFFVHVQARRSPHPLTPAQERDEREACVRMFVCAYPLRAYYATRTRLLRHPRQVEFFRLAAELERSRETLAPLHVPFGLTYTRFTQVENESLADLYFLHPDTTDAIFLARALTLLPERRGSEIERAWKGVLKTWRARPDA